MIIPIVGKDVVDANVIVPSVKSTFADIVDENVSNPVALVRGIVVTESLIPDASVVVVAPAFVPPHSPAPKPRPPPVDVSLPIFIS